MIIIARNSIIEMLCLLYAMDRFHWWTQEIIVAVNRYFFLGNGS